MTNTLLTLDCLVNKARDISCISQTGEISTSDPNFFNIIDLRQGLADIRQHDQWQREVGRQLATLGVTMESIEVPGLGQFWTQGGVNQALCKSQENKEVIKEIFLGLAEQMKKITLWVNVLPKLHAIDPQLGIKKRGDEINLTTADGYTFTNSVTGNYRHLNIPGLDIYHSFPYGPKQGAMMIVGDAVWAKYLQSAEPNSRDIVYQSSLNPGGWKLKSDIATMALSRGGSGGTVILEQGTRADDNSLAIKACGSRPDKDFITKDSAIVNHVNHVLYDGVDPLFKKAAVVSAAA